MSRQSATRREFLAMSLAASSASVVGCASRRAARVAHPRLTPRPVELTPRVRAALATAERQTIRRVEFMAWPRLNWLGLRVETSAGVAGHAVYHAHEHPLRNVNAASAQLALRELLVGRTPSEIPQIWEAALSAGLPPGLLWMADVALWDLTGHAAGKPVYRLLGGVRDKIDCYASSGLWLGEPDVYVADARAIRERGYHGYKVHPYTLIAKNAYPAVSGGDPAKDKLLLVRLREAMGPEFPMMWDNFRTYGHDDALEIGRMLGEHGYLWHESPLLEDNEYCMREYVRLRKALKGVIPICAPEHVAGAHWERLDWMKAAATDINRIDPNYGGFTGPLLLSEACTEAGMPLELHFHSPYEYNLQVAGASPVHIVRHIEVFDGNPGVGRNEFLAGESRRRAAPGRPIGLLDTRDVDLEGRMPLPDLPGMGVEVDWAQLIAS